MILRMLVPMTAMLFACSTVASLQEQRGTDPSTDVAVLAAVKAEEAAVVAAQIVEDVRQASAEPAWLAATRRVAQVAALHAAAVDRDARFPVEAFEAMRRERLLSAMIPAALGGAGLTLAEMARICETLARACSSTAS